MIGAGIQSFAKNLKVTKKQFKQNLGNIRGEDASEVDSVLEKSKKVMEKLKKQEEKIKTHVTTKSDFKYTDALKITKEKKAAFIKEIVKIAKASKGEATAKYFR